MNKSVKKIVESLVITTVTLVMGFIITSISFNLFDNLNNNQMKVLFAIDVICLIAVGSFFFVLSETKNAKKKRKQSFEKRHRERIEQKHKQFNEIECIINNSNFAA